MSSGQSNLSRSRSNSAVLGNRDMRLQGLMGLKRSIKFMLRKGNRCSLGDKDTSRLSSPMHENEHILQLPPQSFDPRSPTPCPASNMRCDVKKLSVIRTPFSEILLPRELDIDTASNVNLPGGGVGVASGVDAMYPFRSEQVSAAPVKVRLDLD